MRHIEDTVHVSAPIEEVFDLAIDPHRMSLQMPWIKDIREVHGTGDRLGDSYRFTDHVLGRSIGGQTVVTACRRPLLQTSETTYDNGIRVIWTMHFVTEEGGTTVRNAVWWAMPDGIVGRAEDLLMRPVIEHRLREARERFVAMAAEVAKTR